MSGRFDQKKTKRPGAPDLDQDQEQEQDLDQEKKPETSRAQSQMGNAALAAMISGRAAEGLAGEGGGGGGQSIRRRRDAEHGDLDYGGDDDIVDDLPISLEDLTRSWNPTTRKSDDRPRFVEPMPDDDLPPEDATWIEAARKHPSAGPLPRITTIDALLQPSAQVVAASIGGWARATGRWAAPTPGHRSLAWLAASGAPLLQVSDARVLPARAAVGALGTCVLAACPAVIAAPTIETGALIEFCLELEGRGHRVDNLVSELNDQAAKLPRATALLDVRLGAGGGSVAPLELPLAARTSILTALRSLARWTSIEAGLEPLRSAPEPVPDPDDPLGVDAILDEHTGGAADPNDGVYAAALLTAERIAGEASRTRIVWVAVAMLVNDVAQLWTGSVGPTLRRAAEQLDQEVDGTLKLLLEVARACQKRSFGPRSLGNGLNRAAARLDKLREDALTELAALIGGILPGAPQVPEPRILRRDPLVDADQAGAPRDASAWVDALPDSLDTDLAQCALLVIGETPAAELLDPLTALRRRALAEGPPSPIATAVTILLAHTHAQLGDHDAALDLAAALRTVGRARRNGLLVAEGAILAIEAHRAQGAPDLAEAVRLEAGRLCLDLDAHGALTLLARWRPADPDEPEG